MVMQNKKSTSIKHLVAAIGLTFAGLAQAAPENVAIGPNGESLNVSSGIGKQALSANGSTAVIIGNVNNSAMAAWARDRQAQSTQLISKALGGQIASASSIGGASADGRYIAFVSSDNTLVSDDTNGVSDVFVADRTTGGVTRVSVANNGAQLEATYENTWGNYVGSTGGAISANGRFVVFVTPARSLQGDNTNNDFHPNVYVRDLIAGTTKRVNLTSENTNGYGTPYVYFQNGTPPILPARISADGRFVLFSNGNNLVQDGRTAPWYVRDRLSETTERLEISADNLASWDLSANGRYVAYYSTNGKAEVFDRQTKTVDSLAPTNAGAQSAPISISASGRYVTYRAKNPDGALDAYVFDRETRQSANLRHHGITGSNTTISSDGRHIQVERQIVANPLFAEDGFCSIYNPYISE